MRPYHNIHPYYERLKHLRGSIILVEGIIGAGKSTLGRELSTMLNDIGIKARLFEEEINMPLLELFLSDMKRYAFTFQMYMLQNRQGVYRDAITYAEQHNGISIVDRSLFGDIAFAMMHHSSGNIESVEWNVYQSTIESTTLRMPSSIIYLDVSPSTAMRRISSRNRGSESSQYDEEYLRSLHDSYMKSMEEVKDQVHFIDWNKDRKIDTELLLDLVKQIDPR